jgi:hypothetical protein
MAASLAYNTVSPLLASVLTDIMAESSFDNFILVVCFIQILLFAHTV